VLATEALLVSPDCGCFGRSPKVNFSYQTGGLGNNDGRRQVPYAGFRDEHFDFLRYESRLFCARNSLVSIVWTGSVM